MLYISILLLVLYEVDSYESMKLTNLRKLSNLITLNIIIYKMHNNVINNFNVCSRMGIRVETGWIVSYVNLSPT